MGAPRRAVVMAPAAKKRKAAEAKGKAAAAAMPEAKGKAKAAAPSKAKGKAKAQEPPPRAWAAEALADIDAATDPEALKSLVEELSRLNAIAKERLGIAERAAHRIAKRAAHRTGLVVLVDSKHVQDCFDLSEEDYSYLRSVEAKFTLGPKAAPFELRVRREAEPYEGYEGCWADVRQFAELCASNNSVLKLEETEHDLELKMFGKKFKRNSSEEHAKELADFLTAAGLERALPKRALNKDGTAMSDEELNAMPDAKRHEWVLLDVLYDAASLLEVKHGVEHDENSDYFGFRLGNFALYEAYKDALLR